MNHSEFTFLFFRANAKTLKNHFSTVKVGQISKLYVFNFCLTSSYVINPIFLRMK